VAGLFSFCGGGRGAENKRDTPRGVSTSAIRGGIGRKAQGQ